MEIPLFTESMYRYMYAVHKYSLKLFSHYFLSFLESDVKSKEKENQEKTSSGDLVPNEVENVANDPEVKGDSDVKGEVEKNKGSDPDPKAGVLSDSFSATSEATQENYFAAALTKSDG